MIQRRLTCGLFAAALAGIGACGSSDEPAGPDLTAPAALLVTPDSLRLPFNDTARVHVVVLNVAGDTLPNAPVSFESEDTTVVRVDSTGLVRALSGGVSDVSVRSGSVTRAVRVRVRINGTLTVTPAVSLISSTDTLQLTVVVKDSTGTIVPSASIQYRSPDTTVVRVLSSGRVVFGGSAGTVIIEVSSEGRKGGVFVTAVIARIEGVEGTTFALNPAGDLFAYVPNGGAGYFYRYRLPGTFPTAAVNRNIEFYGTAAVDATASRLYVGDNFFGTITVMDIAADTVINVLDVTVQSFQPRPPYAMATAPNGELFFNADNTMSRMSVDAMSTTPVFQFGRAYHTVIRDTLLYVSGDADIREYNLRTGALGRQFAGTRYAYGLAVNPQGTRLYSTTTSFFPLRIAVRDLTTGDTLPSITMLGHSGPSDYEHPVLGVQPTTGLLWIIANSARVLVIDPATGRIVREVRPGGSPKGIVFAASGMGVLGNGSGWMDFVR